MMLVALTISSGAIDQETQKQQVGSVLSIRVDSFQIENGTMEDALRALRLTDNSRILIGFEKVARRPGEKEKTLSLSVSNATVGEILNNLCRLDSRYNYEPVRDLMVHVFPVNHSSDPAGLLDIRIADVSIEGKVSPVGAVEGIASFAPELFRYMAKKHEEYLEKRGIVSGSPGSNMSGNGDPDFHLHLENITVRQLLNELVIYSIEVSRNSKPNIGGIKIPPTSWIYEFIIDPDSPTGLGGTPHWIAF
jgi:hypothetical protein